MYGIPDIPCPDCRRPLVSVRAYSRAIGLDTQVFADDLTSPVDALGELDGPGAVSFGFEVLNGAIDGVLGWFHKQKARCVCRRLLTENPRTKAQICAQCLFVYTPRG